MLIVDSDHATLATLAVLLGREFEVETAPTASEGLRRLAGRLPDLMILELTSAGGGGAALFWALRAKQPSCAVLILTADVGYEALREVIPGPIDGFFPTPVPVDQVLVQASILLSRSGRPPLKRLDHHVCTGIEYLSHHYARRLSVETVAHATGLSLSRLTHLFRSEVGMSVGQYVARIRVETAKSLLLTTNDTLDAIAERLGFCDASHLSRVFRVHTGHWPGTFRRLPVGATESFKITATSS